MEQRPVQLNKSSREAQTRWTASDEKKTDRTVERGDGVRTLEIRLILLSLILKSENYQSEERLSGVDQPCSFLAVKLPNFDIQGCTFLAVDIIIFFLL